MIKKHEVSLNEAIYKFMNRNLASIIRNGKVIAYVHENVAPDTLERRNKLKEIVNKNII